MLVEVDTPTPNAPLTVLLNGRNVTAAFRAPQWDRHPRGLLTGLRSGQNEITARSTGKIKSVVGIVNHSLAGPIFSGPHQAPFICETEANGLGPALDSDCAAKTIVQYYYKSTESTETLPTAARGALTTGFKAYDPSLPRPPDVAQTVTADGRTVSYIVRRELGTINRAVYEIQFLHEPGQPLPTPWEHPQSGWNGRLVYFFEGGCGAGYHQGTLEPVGAPQEPIVGQGYAFATSSLNVFQNSCNDRISAETLSMVKEHFIKEYGEPIHTIGWGGSGGSIQLYLTAQNYPGLLDGIIPYISFPDMATSVQTDTDCSLLHHAFDTSSAVRWTEEQKTAISGFATWRTCPESAESPDLDPVKMCDVVVPETLLYNKVDRPLGARCDVYDNEVNIFGSNPSTGHAYQPLDNVGVQYGLMAFQKGLISSEQFVELNERVGGYDGDGEIVETRTEAEAEAVRTAYRRGLVLTGGGGLAQIPIIDWRPYTDDLADEHVRFRSLATRERLISANGSAGNQVILVFPRYAISELRLAISMQTFESVFAKRGQEILGQMDHWLDAIAADRTPGNALARIVRNKPSALSDGCRDINDQELSEPATFDQPGRCNDLYPVFGDPRLAAGAPRADDVLKCTLKPLNAADYSQPLTTMQLKRLAAVFPKGVCDYSHPGLGQEVTMSTWQHSDMEPDSQKVLVHNDALPSP